MNSLFEAARHEPTSLPPITDVEARAAIKEIVDETGRAWRGSDLWQEHPGDREMEPARGLTSLFFGAAGTLWALHDLARSGLAPSPVDLESAAHAMVAAHRTTPDDDERAPGLLLGDLGVYTVAWEITRDSAYQDAALKAARAAISKPELELMWAAPGAVFAAAHFLSSDASAAWDQVGAEAVEHLWRTWEHDRARNIWMWTQNLYGRVRQLLGAVHGFAGNAQALLAGSRWLSAANRDEVLRRIALTLKRTALTAGGGVNWPAMPLTDVPPAKILTQYCHGAPGILTTLARYPKGCDAEFDLMLLRAGELTWEAGPLIKPQGICHGSAGNAYAFLMLAARTGDDVWRHRARRFGAHAIAQSNSAAAKLGRRRMGLWLGDLGLAVFLGDLVECRGKFWPTIERF